MVHIGWLLGGIFLGMTLLGMCVISGNAERDAERGRWEPKYQKRIAGLHQRILELEDALSAREGLDAHHKGETLPWEEVKARLLDTAVANEQIHQDLLDADIAWNEQYALDQAASLEA